MPSEQELLAKYPWIASFTRDDILKATLNLKTAAKNHVEVENFYSVLEQIIAKGMYSSENKSESVTDNLFLAWVNTHPLINRIGSKFLLDPKNTLKLNIGNATAEVINDSSIRYRNPSDRKSISISFVEESKSLNHNKTAEELQAQRLAEMLVMATDNNPNVNQVQEAFCISVTHESVSFWHTIFPGQYLRNVFLGNHLPYNQPVEVKGYAGPSGFGLQLTDPAERILAFRLLWGLVNYVDSGVAFMGNQYDAKQKIHARKALDTTKLEKA